MSTDNPEINRAADYLIGTLKEYYKRIDGKVLNSKEIAREVQAVIKRRV